MRRALSAYAGKAFVCPERRRMCLEYHGLQGMSILAGFAEMFLFRTVVGGFPKDTKTSDPEWIGG